MTATKIVETPVTSVSQHTAGDPEHLPASGTVLIAKGAPTPRNRCWLRTKQARPQPRQTLPKTASGWPLVGILGLLFISVSFGLALFRRVMRFRS